MVVLLSVFVLGGAGGQSASRGCVGDGGRVSFGVVCVVVFFFSRAQRGRGVQSTLPVQSTLRAEHAPLRSTLLAEHASLQSTLLCRARSCVRARFFAEHEGAEHAPGQSTLLVRARFLCRARSLAEHAPGQSTLLCTARFFAEHAPVQSTLLCRARSCAAHFFADMLPGCEGGRGASQLPGCVQTGYALSAFSRRAGWCL